MKVSYIYVLKHPLTEEIRYVGQTTRKTYRIKEHICDAKQMIDGEYVNNRHVCKWIRKVLGDCDVAPIFEIIDSGIDGEEADGLEIKYVNEFLEKGVRLTNLIGGGKKGYMVTDDVILERMSKSGLKVAERTKRRVGQYDLNGNLLREFISISEAGKSILPYTKSNYTNISGCCNNRNKTAYGYIWKFTMPIIETTKTQKQIKTQKKPILQYDLEGNFIKEYSSMTEASEYTGILNCDLSYCCSGKSKSAGGYQWVFKTDIIETNIGKYEITRTFEKPVLQYSLNGEFIKKYNTITEASESMKVSKSAFSQYFKNKRKSCAGYIWVIESHIE